MSCSDEAKTPCHGQIRFSIDAKPMPITVLALLTPGNVYFQFRAGEKKLLAGSQPYEHVAIGRIPSETARVDLVEETSVSREEVPNSLYHQPVLRYPHTVLATLQIDIRPSR